MARVTPWRTHCPEAVQMLHLQALDSPPLFLLRQRGPFAFDVKEGTRRKPRLVYLGDPHQCSCHEFRKSHDLCLHLCWVLLRKLKLQPDDPLAYQLGMVPQELSRLLYSKDKHCGPIRKRAQRDVTNETLGEVTSRKITKEDVCPICLENLLEKKSPVTHCRYGCGQAVHIHCMKVMVRHQMEGVLEKNIGHTMLFCPLCRGDFTTWQSLQQEERNAPSKKRTLLNSIRRHSSNQKLQEVVNQPNNYCSKAEMLAVVHYNVGCSGCAVCPVMGTLYRCLKCPHVVLCHPCATSSQHMRELHAGHGFAFKQRPGERWLHLPLELSGQDHRISLANKFPNVQPADTGSLRLPAELLSELPTQKVRAGHFLLARGQQCCLCLQPYKVKQMVRMMPCGHQFHDRCLCQWLLQTSGTCPIDGSVVKPTLLHKTLRRECRPPPARCRGQRKSLPEVRGKAGVVAPSISVQRVVLVERRYPSQSPSLESRKEWITPLRAYSLPPRPLLGIKPRPQRLSDSMDLSTRNVLPQASGSDPVSLSVTSLSLPAHVCHSPCLSELTPRSKVVSHWLASYKGTNSFPLSQEDSDIFSELGLSPALNIRCTRLELSPRTSIGAVTRRN